MTWIHPCFYLTEPCVACSCKATLTEVASFETEGCSHIEAFTGDVPGANLLMVANMWDGTSPEMQATSYVYRVDDGEAGKLVLTGLQRLPTKGGHSAEIFTPSHGTRETLLLTNYMRCGSKQKALRNGKTRPWFAWFVWVRNLSVSRSCACSFKLRTHDVIRISSRISAYSPIFMASFPLRCHPFPKLWFLVCYACIHDSDLSQEKHAVLHPSTYGIRPNLRYVQYGFWHFFRPLLTCFMVAGG